MCKFIVPFDHVREAEREALLPGQHRASKHLAQVSRVAESASHKFHFTATADTALKPNSQAQEMISMVFGDCADELQGYQEACTGALRGY